MALPDALTKPIDEFKTAAVKVLVIVLLLGIIALWANLLYDKYTARNTAEDKAAIYKVELDYWKRIAAINDSLYNDCGDKRYNDATNSKESIKTRQLLNDTINKLVNKIK